MFIYITYKCGDCNCTDSVSEVFSIENKQESPIKITALLKKLMVAQFIKNIQISMKPEDQLSCSQELAANLCLNPDKLKFSVTGTSL